MKTTIEMPDDLLEEARALAVKEKTTLKSLLVEGLRRVLAQRKRRKRFRLRDASVTGNGLQPGISEGSWEQIRNLSYRGRGS
ncbi:MAG: DUF2191 domain-containing protein [Planctomycetota bacterium]